VLRHWRRQIITSRRRKSQEFLRHQGAYRMKTMIMGPRMTVAVAEKAGYRILATEFNGKAERIQLLIRFAGRFSHYPFTFFIYVV